MEFWIYHTSSVTGNTLILFDWRTAGSGGLDQINFVHSTAGTPARYVYYNRVPPPETFPYPGTLTTNTWHHIAVGCDGTTITRYLDGVAKFSYGANAVFDATRKINIAGFDGNTDTTADGTTEIYIDELRFIIGSCPYTSNFTPPTGPY
jgi:hypothetical protein